MKHISFIVCFLLASFIAKSQVNYDYISSTDTLTNADTVYVTLGKNYYAVGTVECGVTTTNISGTSAGQMRLQVKHSPAGSNWVNVGTDTLALTTGTFNAISCTLNGYNARLRIISTGTQSTQAVTGCTYKKAQ